MKKIPIKLCSFLFLFIAALPAISFCQQKLQVNDRQELTEKTKQLDNVTKDHKISVKTKELSTLGIFLANHDQSTGIELWKIDRWKTEIKNLKKMGANTIWYIPMQHGKHSNKDIESNSAFWTLQKNICKAIIDEGLKVGIYVGYNDVFNETIKQHPEWSAVDSKYSLEGTNICPSIPAARQEAILQRRKVFEELPHIDYLICPITDWGGCGCQKCEPLPIIYMNTFKEMTDLCKQFHPKAKVIASGCGINMEEQDMLRELIRKADWIDHVADIPRGVKPIIKYYLSPEITMANGWGKYGPCPQFKYIKASYMEEINYVSGAVTYSEGIHDDVNRFAVLQFAQNPNRTVTNVAAQYAREWLNLSGKDEKLMAEVIVGLGTNITRGRDYMYYKDGDNNPLADKRLKILIEIRKRNPALQNNYRYWLLNFRAVYESFSTIQGELTIDELYAELKITREAIMRLEPETAHKLITIVPRWEKPDLSPLSWPRTFNYIWKRENSLLKK